jgi:hypothetical protein
LQKFLRAAWTMEAGVHDGSVAELTLFADYYQIHVFDEGSKTDLGDEWTDQASDDHLVSTRRP